MFFSNVTQQQRAQALKNAVYNKDSTQALQLVSNENDPTQLHWQTDSHKDEPCLPWHATIVTGQLALFKKFLPFTQNISNVDIRCHVENSQPYRDTLFWIIHSDAEEFLTTWLQLQPVDLLAINADRLHLLMSMELDKLSRCFWYSCWHLLIPAKNNLLTAYYAWHNFLTDRENIDAYATSTDSSLSLYRVIMAINESCCKSKRIDNDQVTTRLQQLADIKENHASEIAANHPNLLQFINLFEKMARVRLAHHDQATHQQTTAVAGKGYVHVY